MYAVSVISLSDVVRPGWTRTVSQGCGKAKPAIVTFAELSNRISKKEKLIVKRSLIHPVSAGRSGERSKRKGPGNTMFDTGLADHTRRATREEDRGRKGLGSTAASGKIARGQQQQQVDGVGAIAAANRRLLQSTEARQAERWAPRSPPRSRFGGLDAWNRSRGGYPAEVGPICST